MEHSRLFPILEVLCSQSLLWAYSPEVKVVAICAMCLLWVGGCTVVQCGMCGMWSFLSVRDNWNGKLPDCCTCLPNHIHYLACESVYRDWTLMLSVGIDCYIKCLRNVSYDELGPKISIPVWVDQCRHTRNTPCIQCSQWPQQVYTVIFPICHYSWHFVKECNVFVL